MKKLVPIAVGITALIIGARLSFFTVEEGRGAVVIRWNGTLVSEEDRAGLYVKLPDPVERVEVVELRGRSLHIQGKNPGDASGVSYGFDVLWRVNGPLDWWRSFRGSVDDAEHAVSDAVRSAGEAESALAPGAAVALRAAAWTASAVRERAQANLEGCGIVVESVRISEIRSPRRNGDGAAATNDAAFAEEVESPGEIRAAARRSAGEMVARALVQAASLEKSAEDAASAGYGEIEKASGAAGFAEELKKARDSVRAGGPAVPMPEFPLAAGGNR